MKRGKKVVLNKRPFSRWPRCLFCTTRGEKAWRVFLAVDCFGKCTASHTTPRTDRDEGERGGLTIKCWTNAAARQQKPTVYAMSTFMPIPNARRTVRTPAGRS